MSTYINDSAYGMLKQGIEVANMRQDYISNNIANVNTEGYKSFEVVFEENLKSNNKVGMKTTDERHVGANNGAVEVRKNEDSMTLDGNSVDLDYEMINLAANTINYNAMVSQINSKYNAVGTVVKGGR